MEMSKVYEVYFESMEEKAVQKAFDGYLQDSLIETSGNWREDISKDEDFIGLGADGHPHADGPVFRSEIAAHNLQMFLKENFISADLIVLE
jgi:hypothetical protein